MRAAIYHGFGQALEVTELETPRAPAGGVVVEVRATGMCRSDWHGWCGHDPDIRLPHVPGHEWAGVVVALGSGVRKLRLGDRVTAPFVHGCGRCGHCRQGEAQVCAQQLQPGFNHWGSFASHLALHRADFNLLRLPKGLGFAAAASLGCRFATAYRAVLQQGRLQAGEWLAVHGCGGVGLAAVQIAKAQGARVLAVDLCPSRLALASELGADCLFRADQYADLPAALVERSGGGAHVSIDALGSVQTCRNSVLSLRRRGRHLQVGLLAGDDADTLLPLPRVIAWELELLGSHGMAALSYPEMFAFLRRHRLDPAQLCSRRVDLPTAAALLPQMDQEQDRGLTLIDRF